MKFNCDLSALAEAVNNVLPAVSSRSSLSALEGLLLRCAGNSLSLTGYNLEWGITKVIDVRAEEEGEIILPARLLSDILTKCTDGTVNFVTDDKNLTVIKNASAEYTILGTEAGEYPDLPTIAQDNKFTLPAGLLRNMIAQTLFAVSVTDQLPITTGTLFDLSEKTLQMVSVDGCRLAMRKETVNVEKNFYFVVPGKTLAEIQKLLSRFADDDAEEPVELNVSRKHIIFSFRGYSLTSRMLEGEFLDYPSAIPQNKTTTVRVSTREMIRSIERASIIINDRIKSHIHCEFGAEEVAVSCVTAMGKVNDTFGAKLTGEPVTIGFNNKYMTDALRATGCDEVDLEMDGPLSPIKIVPPEGDAFLFLVLPVRMK